MSVSYTHNTDIHYQMAYYNDNDDYIPVAQYDKCASNMETYDWEKEASRLHSLNMLIISEYEQRQRKVMKFLEENISVLPGFEICINRDRTWCKVLIKMVSEPRDLWVPKSNNSKDNIKLELVRVPGQCTINEFEIGLKDMHTMNVEICHIRQRYDVILNNYDYNSDDYDSVNVLTPDKVVPLLQNFQKNGKL
jgi:hypothetical protein